MFFWNAIKGSAAFVLPGVLETLLVALLISFLSITIRSGSEKDKNNKESHVTFSVLFRVAMPFSLFGYVLGTFTGMTGQTLATTIIGTVSTTAATYLAYLYSKDVQTNAPTVIVSALSSFFISVPLAVQYVTHYGT